MRASAPQDTPPPLSATAPAPSNSHKQHSALGDLAWQHLKQRRYTQCQTLLQGLAAISAKLRYIRGRCHAALGKHKLANRDLQILWWHHGAEHWGLAALQLRAEYIALSPYQHRERAAILATLPASLARRRTPLSAQRSARILKALTMHGPYSTLLNSELQLARAHAAMRRNQLQRAARLTSHALKHNRKHPPGLQAALLMLSAQLAEREGQLNEASHTLQRALPYARGDIHHIARARAAHLAYRLGHTRLVTKHWRALLQESPLGPWREEAQWALGWALYRSTKPHAARRIWLNMAHEEPFSPRAVQARYWAARAAADLGEHRQSAREWRALLRDCPMNYYAYRAEQRLRGHPFAQAPAVAPIHSTSLHLRRSHLQQLLQQRHFKTLETELTHSASHDTARSDPATLRHFEQLARQLNRPQLSARFRGIRHRRYPHRDHAAHATLRANFPRKYVQLLQPVARQHHIKASFLTALARQESAFREDAHSPAGAMGLLQLMPTTARSLLTRREQRSFSRKRLLDPHFNATLGARYLARMLKRFDGIQEYALSAYNAGPTATRRWLRAKPHRSIDVFVEEIPYRETKHYIQRLKRWQRMLEFMQTKPPQTIARVP